MKQSSKRLMSLILGFALVGAAFFILTNMVQPKYQEFLDKKAQLSSEQAALQDQQQITEQAQKIIAAFESGADQRSAIDEMLPPDPRQSDVVGEIGGLLALNNITPQSFQIALEQPKKELRAKGADLRVMPLGRINTKLSATGSYDDMKRFLGNVEKNIRALDLTEMSVQSAVVPGSKVQDQYSLNLTLTAYYQEVATSTATSSTQ